MSISWPKVSLGDLIRLERRPVDTVAHHQYQEIGIYCFGRGIFHKTPRSGLEVGDKDLYRLRSGDLILQVTFAWEGAIALCGDKEDGLYGSTRYPTFRVAEDRCFPPYLARYLCTPAGLAQINKICPGSAGRNRVLSIKRIPEISVPLPPLVEQQRIVARIEEIAMEVTQVRDLRAEQENNLSQTLLAEFLRITRNAPRRPIEELAPLVRRPVNVNALESYAELGIRSFGKGTFHKPALTGLEIGNKRVFLIEPGDLLLSNVFAWEGAIAVAGLNDVGRVGSHRYITCVPIPTVATSQFLKFYLLTKEGLGLISAASPGGAGRNRTLGLGALKKIIVPTPPIEVQKKFDTLQAEVNALKRLQNETASELDAILPAILDRAFKGEL